MVHDLKISPSYFDDVCDGKKKFEVRFNDRNYHVGDCLLLREYVASNGAYIGYSGRFCVRHVTYILSDPDYVKHGFVILGIE